MATISINTLIQRLRLYVLLPLMLLLNACGGGGGGGGDITPPVLTAPANINVAANSVSGTPATDSAIAAFLTAASATDNIDGAVSVTNNAPVTFPASSTSTVTFSASDTVGNIGTATATVTVGAFVGGGGSTWIGTKQLGVAAANTFGESVATDANGNVFITGGTTGGLDGNALTGTFDTFLTRYDSTGVKQYTRQLGVSGSVTGGHAVATDTNGNVYVAGSTNGGLDGNALTRAFDFFLTKYDSTGVKQYTRQLGVSGVDTGGNAVATDADGNVYVTGFTSGSLDGNVLSGISDFYLTKYDSTGVKQYTQQLGVAAANTYGYSVATDNNGNVYVAGSTKGGLDGNALTGTEDFFVTKYDSIGTKQYTRQLGVAAANTYGYSVATDNNGNVYVAGYTTGGLDGNALTGIADAFFTKYDNTGAKQYTRQLGVATKGVIGRSVATDANGNVYLQGGTGGGLDGNVLTGSNDLFVTKYDSTGVKQYTRQLGVLGANTNGASVATDTNGNVYVTGHTNGGLDGNVLTGSNDLFVTKYDSTGVKQ